jgi:predicted small secreted protein
MKKAVLTLLLCALFASASPLYAADCNTMAGGVPVVIPPPGKEFAEVGSDKRDFFEYMVPSSNRLLCAFVPADFLPRLKNPATGMGQYMVVELSRKLDERNTEVTSAGFKQVVLSMKQQLADSSTLNQTAQTTSAEISSKLKQLHQSKEVSIDQPAPRALYFRLQMLMRSQCSRLFRLVELRCE